MHCALVIGQTQFSGDFPSAWSTRLPLEHSAWFVHVGQRWFLRYLRYVSCWIRLVSHLRDASRETQPPVNSHGVERGECATSGLGRILSNIKQVNTWGPSHSRSQHQIPSAGDGLSPLQRGRGEVPLPPPGQSARGRDGVREPIPSGGQVCWTMPTMLVKCGKLVDMFIVH